MKPGAKSSAKAFFGSATASCWFQAMVVRMTSSMRSRRRPARVPRTSASAVAVRIEVARRLLVSFMASPMPRSPQ